MVDLLRCTYILVYLFVWVVLERWDTLNNSRYLINCKFYSHNLKHIKGHYVYLGGD